MRSKSGKPTSEANCLRTVDTAGCERCSSSAAREKFMWRAAVANTRSCRRVILRIATSGSFSSRNYEIVMPGIESFNFYSDKPGRRVAAGGQGSGCGMSAVSDPVRTSEELTAELEAYNRAFSELELPWRWNAQTLRHLLTV